jgi:hypothetical protein
MDTDATLDAVARRIARRAVEERRAAQAAARESYRDGSRGGADLTNLRADLLALLDRYDDSALPPESRAAILAFMEHLLGGGGPPPGVPVWRFVMLALDSISLWKKIRGLPPEKRPQEVTDAFYISMLHIEPNTGIMQLTRDELAELMERSPNSAGKAMATLVELGVYTAEYERIPGLRGRGKRVWRVNPDLAWAGHLPMRVVQKHAAAARRRAAAAAGADRGGGSKASPGLA